MASKLDCNNVILTFTNTPLNNWTGECNWTVSDEFDQLQHLNNSLILNTCATANVFWFWLSKQGLKAPPFLLGRLHPGVPNTHFMLVSALWLRKAYNRHCTVNTFTRSSWSWTLLRNYNLVLLWYRELGSQSILFLLQQKLNAYIFLQETYKCFDFWLLNLFISLHKLFPLKYLQIKIIGFAFL